MFGEFWLPISLVISYGHVAVLCEIDFCAHVYPGNTRLAVFEQQLVKLAVGEDEVEVANAFLNVTDMYVGSFTEHVLRRTYTMDSLVESRTTVTTVYEDRAELVA